MLKRIWLVEPPAPDLHVFSHSDLPRLGLPILGTILKQNGYDVTIFTPRSGPVDPLELAQGDLVGISITTSTAPHGYELADRIRRLSEKIGTRVPIVFGGVHATFMPEEALRHGDFVLRKEAEESFPKLLAALAGECPLPDVPGLSYREDRSIRHNQEGPPIWDLDGLPIPDLSLIRGYKPKVSPVLTSRGCPHNCTFCCVTRMMGRHYRFAGTEHVLSELRQLPTRNVFFYDDNFAADRRRTKELLHAMIGEKLGLEWGAQVRPDLADDEELLVLMREAGCNTLYIGFESANQKTLEELNKNLSIEGVKRNIGAMKKHGFHIHGMFIFGADSDRHETIRGTVRFARRTGIDTVQFMLLTPLPGTPLYASLQSAGRLLTDDWSLYDGANVVFKPAGMTAYELQKLTRWALRKFYSWPHLIQLACGREWQKAGAAIYARHILRRWYGRHRREIRQLRLIGGSS